MKDLFGNEIEEPKAKGSRNVYALLGATNHSRGARQKEDYYATHPIAAAKLMEIEDLPKRIWEPCAGECHLADVFESAGHEVYKSDIVVRRDDVVKQDFLLADSLPWQNGLGICTNPPFSLATPMIRHAMDILPVGCRLYMFLRILFLESLERKALFAEYPPLRVWISSQRIPCAKNGDFNNNAQSAQAYAWYVFEKGYKGESKLGWF